MKHRDIRAQRELANERKHFSLHQPERERPDEPEAAQSEQPKRDERKQIGPLDI